MLIRVILKIIIILIIIITIIIKIIIIIEIIINMGHIWPEGEWMWLFKYRTSCAQSFEVKDTIHNTHGANTWNTTVYVTKVCGNLN